MHPLVKELNYPDLFRQRLINLRGDEYAEYAIHEYKTNLSRQFENILPFLSSISFNSVLDIGCGLAGIDVLIAKQFGVRRFHLLDGDGSGEKKTGFNVEAMQPWDDVSRGVLFFNSNTSDDIECFSHNESDPLDFCVDLVISSRALAHHFPVDPYIERIKACLCLGGHLILDIRNNTDGKDVLEQHGFVFTQNIPDKSLKCMRMAFSYPGV